MDEYRQFMSIYGPK